MITGFAGFESRFIHRVRFDKLDTIFTVKSLVGIRDA